MKFMIGSSVTVSIKHHTEHSFYIFDYFLFPAAVANPV